MYTMSFFLNEILHILEKTLKVIHVFVLTFSTRFPVYLTLLIFAYEQAIRKKKKNEYTAHEY